jgi:hypothetical protein
MIETAFADPLYQCSADRFQGTPSLNQNGAAYQTFNLNKLWPTDYLLDWFQDLRHGIYGHNGLLLFPPQ